MVVATAMEVADRGMAAEEVATAVVVVATVPAAAAEAAEEVAVRHAEPPEHQAILRAHSRRHRRSMGPASHSHTALRQVCCSCAAATANMSTRCEGA